MTEIMPLPENIMTLFDWTALCGGIFSLFHRFLFRRACGGRIFGCVLLENSLQKQRHHDRRDGRQEKNGPVQRKAHAGGEYNQYHQKNRGGQMADGQLKSRADQVPNTKGKTAQQGKCVANHPQREKTGEVVHGVYDHIPSVIGSK